MEIISQINFPFIDWFDLKPKSFFVLVILYPLVLEMCFRLGLKNFKNNSFYILLTVISVTFFQFTASSKLFFILCIYGVIIATITFFRFYEKKYFDKFYYFLSIFFYILSYWTVIDTNLLTEFLLLTVFFIFLAILFNYLRIKYSFILTVGLQSLVHLTLFFIKNTSI